MRKENEENKDTRKKKMEGLRNQKGELEGHTD